ncbi:MAG: DUF2306 domain-containing protein [Pseudomonadota bacterium]
MNPDPLMQAGWVVQAHVLLALLALALGPVALWRKRRDMMHKSVGYVWVVALAGAALVSFAIPSSFTPFGAGPIHLLSVYALGSLWVAMRAIWRRDVARHRAVMESLYVRGVVLAGAFTLLPGRVLQRSLIPDAPELGFAVMAAVLVWVASPVLRVAVARVARLRA